MQLEKKHKKKILILCPHPENVAPGQRLKYEQYFPYFRENNIEVEVSPFMSMKMWNIVYKKGNVFGKIFWTFMGYFRRVFDMLRLSKYDCVYVFLYVTPFGSTFFEYLTSKLSKNLIYDIDDLIFLKPKSKANPIIQLFKSDKKPSFLMKKADHVITCTPYLDKYVRKFNEKTTDISSTINTETYIPVNSYENDIPIVLGWSGSFSTSKYLYLLEDLLKELNDTFNIEILVIGDPSFSIEGLNVKAMKWKEETEVSDLQKIDIGLYPLPNEEWVLGKSGLKALQYMSLGIPTVATKIGANHRVIEDGVSGFLVDSMDEWKTRIIQLIENAELRKKMGKQARDRVVSKYSILANRDTYLNIINELVERNQ